MDLKAFSFLLSRRGRRLLDDLAQTPITPETHLSLASRLRQEVGADQAHALLETALLRQRATVKFSRAAQMFFTRAALEQASPEAVSRHRARRFAALNGQRVADLGCGIGGDAISLATGAHVVGVDRDRLRLAMARYNVTIYGHGRRFQPLQADLRELPPLPVDAFFCDPGRRDAQGRRYSSLYQSNPPLLPLLERWLPEVPHAAVKVSPGVDYNEIPDHCEIEFVSLEGEVKEGVLWFGRLRSDASRRATLLPQGVTISDEEAKSAPNVPITEPQSFLYEPDGAVIRAHLVQTLAQQLQAALIDETIAYLTADRAVDTPFARCFAIEEALPFQLKQLRHRLRRRGIGRVTVKKRGSPITPEELQRQLRLEGEREAIVFLTRVRGAPYALIGHEVTFP
ncbi:MAG TPA: class I SAM-dependent methyltransferase [Candidatus Sulfomarinibacteraceae bacterium]|nr:class I SAM-dependent methyltransferase [Candidatus Sulfomarinibacteraceae bacterium]